jgi:hypothetical protein
MIGFMMLCYPGGEAETQQQVRRAHEPSDLAAAS